MKFITVAVILVACYFAVEFSVAQDETNSTAAPPAGNKTCKGHKGRNRGKRDVAADIQKQLKDFGDKLGKSNDEIKTAVKKFMDDQGMTTMEIAQAFLKGGESAKQMLQNIEKAIAG